MNLQIPNWLESLLIAVAVQALSAILNYLQGGQPFTWTGLGAAVLAALLSYATSAGWAKYIPVNLITPQAPIINVHVPQQQPQQQPQASVSITTPPSATGNAEATTITATAGDMSTAPALPPVTPDVTVDAIVPATPDTQESGSAVVAAAEVVPEAAPAHPTRMVLIDGTPYVPAGGVL